MLVYSVRDAIWALNPLVPDIYFVPSSDFSSLNVRGVYIDRGHCSGNYLQSGVLAGFARFTNSVRGLTLFYNSPDRQWTIHSDFSPQRKVYSDALCTLSSAGDEWLFGALPWHCSANLSSDSSDFWRLTLNVTRIR